MEPQLPTVSTDYSVEMVGTEDECSDAASACGSNSSSGSDYVPPGETGQLCVSPIDVGNQNLMFVGLTSQLQEFLDGMNENMRCQTKGCSGKYVPINTLCQIIKKFDRKNYERQINT